MNMSHTVRKHSGFSLLEVLVAIVIFAVGLLAIAALQGSLMQSGSDAKARTVASSLAEEQVEQLRSFMNGDDFDVIAGGAEEVIEGGVDFHRTTTVTDYYYAKAGGNIALTEGTDPATGEADAKHVAVTVSWCDSATGSGCDETNLEGDPAPNTVIVEDVVSRSSSPVGSAKALSELTPNSPPNVPYDPGEAPEVISIDLGDGKKRETPEPTIKTTRKNNQLSDDPAVNTVTRLETITFTPPPEGAEEAGTVRRQEFIAVNCSCELQAAPTDEDAQGKTPYYWDGTDYVGGERVSKPIGVSTLGNSDNIFLSEMCGDCCRDHHDVPGENIMYDHDSDAETDEILSRFDPFRKDDAGNLTQHQHYAPNNQDILEPVNQGEEYLEACRFVRVDGELRVANDFRLESLQTLPANTCDDFVRDSKGAECVGTLTNESGDWIDDYRQYVTGFVSEYLEQVQGNANYPETTPLLTDGADGLSALPTTDLVPGGANDPSAEARELVSRAIFIDYLTPQLLNRIACREGTGSDCDDRRDPDGDPVLPIVPFYEVNVQLQANWAVSGGDLVGVTSFPIDEDEYSRGFVFPVNLDGSETQVVASIEQGNVGLTDTHTVYPGTQLVQDGLLYGSGDDGSTDPVIAGRIIINPDLSQGNRLQPSDVVVTSGESESCAVPEGQDLYECALDEFAAGQVVVAGYTSVKNNGDILSNNMVCLQTPSGIINGVVTDNGTADETTTFTFDAMDPPEDRTGYDLLVEPENAPDKCVGNI